MEKNVGGADRWTRWIAGGALVLYGLNRSGWRRSLSFAAASSLIGTASIQKCLLNKVFGINSHPGGHETRLANHKPLVEETSEESFPASDAPAWAGNR